eukprot:m.269609 g.269609  ORF g.269609 m.269609 type:complete len:79 (+) comp79581_c0_seq1:48-284(+)
MDSYQTVLIYLLVGGLFSYGRLLVFLPCPVCLIILFFLLLLLSFIIVPPPSIIPSSPSILLQRSLLFPCSSILFVSPR